MRAHQSNYGESMLSRRRFWGQRLWRAVFAGLVLAVFGQIWGSQSFFGIYLQGEKIGYMSIASSPAQGGTRTVVVTRIHALLLGTETKIDMTSDSLADSAGRIKQMGFTMTSGGRTQKVDAVVGKDEIAVTRSTETGTEKKRLPVPKGAEIVDDPTVAALRAGMGKANTKITFYAFDPVALSLLKNDLIFKGETNVTVDKKTQKAMWVQVVDPRASSDIYLSSSGEVVVMRSVFGMEMRPISRKDALGSNDYVPSVDIASASRVVPDEPIENARSLKRLKLRLEGPVSSRLISDANQTVTPNDGGVILEIHPAMPPAAEAWKIEDLKGKETQFASPADLIPSDSATFRNLAKQIVGSETNSLIAAKKIAEYVYKVMKPNASIGVIRDAAEILKTKEGVCRDYAMLTCTLMRAAGIPSKLATGAVYANDGFYYHAWVEAFIGSCWVPLDATMNGGFDAAHIKFVEGNPDSALVVFTLDGVKIKVLSK